MTKLLTQRSVVLPKLVTEKDWDAFYSQAQFLLAKPQFSPGASLRLVTTDDNRPQSEALDDKIVPSLGGDAKALFDNTGSEFVGRGFERLAQLKEFFMPESDRDGFKALYSLFTAIHQPSETVVAFVSHLMKLFSHINSCGHALSLPLQAMFVVKGLNSSYDGIREEFIQGPECHPHHGPQPLH